MEYIRPEAAGISASSIKQYIEVLENSGLSNHGLIMLKGDKIFYEGYWAPFDENFQHRMYSVSKSFVSIAIGFCEQEGLLCLDDRIAKYFPEEVKLSPDGCFGKQTIRDMLMMATERIDRHWLQPGPDGKYYDVDDRVRFYFENDLPDVKAPGAIYDYDSTGSFVLGALVERLTGMPFMEYLRIKLFDEIGVSKEAKCLKCPGGHSWSDSAVLCTARDLLLVAKFVTNKGVWNGKQILNAEYLTAATAKQIDNSNTNTSLYGRQGYGYQFWRTYDNSFFFNGMGGQVAVCIPDKDLIFVRTGDDENLNDWARELMIERFFALIARPMSENALPKDDASNEELAAYSKELKLITAKGKAYSDIQEKINGVTYEIKKNPMGIKKVMFTFEGDEGVWHYENAQGEKQLRFGLSKNVFTKFPQEGYAKEVGHVVTKGHFYDCAVSSGWVEPHSLFMMVQLIDNYLGKLNISFSFKENTCSIKMRHYAEDLLKEYEGFAWGEAK